MNHERPIVLSDSTPLNMRVSVFIGVCVFLVSAVLAWESVRGDIKGAAERHAQVMKRVEVLEKEFRDQKEILYEIRGDVKVLNKSIERK